MITLADLKNHGITFFPTFTYMQKKNLYLQGFFPFFSWSFCSSSTLSRPVCLAYVRGFYFLFCCVKVSSGVLCCVCCIVLYCVVLRCVALCCLLCCDALCCVVLLTSSAFLVFRLCYHVKLYKQTNSTNLTHQQTISTPENQTYSTTLSKQINLGFTSV